MSKSNLKVFVFLFLLTGCDALDPNVGPVQDAAPACGTTTDVSSTYGATTPAKDAGACTKPDPRCAADSGYEDGPCDHCEDIYCCTARFECYDDPGCFIADEARDNCSAAVAADAGDGDASAKANACWNAFVASGPIEKTRYACLQSNCQATCGTP
jgi:hypothetical protein